MTKGNTDTETTHSQEEKGSNFQDLGQADLQLVKEAQEIT
jgi:hypothetical protein